MVTRDGARSIIGIIGNVISFGLFLSPVPTFWKIIKRRAVEEFSPYPYLATMMNCMLWVFYGIPVVKPNSLLVVTINSIGLALEITYLIIFFIFAPNKKRLRVLMVLAGELVFMTGVVLVVILAAHTHASRTLIVGILCVIFGTCMYGSPLLVMRMVIRTKSVKYMPFFLSLASFLNGLCWTTYALIEFDVFITIPNGLGALFGLAQLILYFWYYRKSPVDELPTAIKPEVQLSGPPPPQPAAAASVIR